MNNSVLNLCFGVSDKFKFLAVNENGDYAGKLKVENEVVSFIDKNDTELKFDTIEKANKYISNNNFIFRNLSSESRWISYNPNPKKNNTDDCSIRAYTKAFNIKYEDDFNLAMKYSKEMFLIVTDSRLINKLLKKEFNVSRVKNNNKETVNAFAMSHPKGTYILHVHGHMVTCKDGYFYDSWDSSSKKVLGYYEINDK